LDLRNMVLVAEAVALAALERQESRGGHTREDFPMTDPYWGGLNVVVGLEPPTAEPDGSGVSVKLQPLPKPPPELADLLEDVH
jgi:succinate dehydrogenase / fumarate reductase, flavoprotein subunit